MTKWGALVLPRCRRPGFRANRGRAGVPLTAGAVLALLTAVTIGTASYAAAAGPARHDLPAPVRLAPRTRPPAVATAELTSRITVAQAGVQLPGGGRVLFPGHLLVALYGHPGAPALGALGQQGLQASIARARKVAAAYRPLTRARVIPAFEIIATVAQASPGQDGDYSYESPVASLRPWVRQATAAGFYVILDLSPAGPACSPRPGGTSRCSSCPTSGWPWTRSGSWRRGSCRCGR